MLSTEATVRTLLEAAVRAGLVPGAVAGWGSRAGVRVVAAGAARVVGGAAPAKPETVYDLASLTKPLATTTLFLLARRRGLLDLDTPLGAVVEEVRGRWLETVPLRHLLTHTAGLPAWVPIYALGSRDRWIQNLSDIDPLGPPGAAVVYSCPGFLLLGAALERVLGLSLSEAFRRLVTEPLGLGDELRFWNGGPAVGEDRLAGAAPTPAAESRALAERGLDTIAVPPAGQRPDDGNARFLGGAAGNAGLFGTARAVLGLALEYLPGGTLLRPEEISLATRNWTPRLQQARALGWQLAATPGCSAGPALPGNAFGHTGFTGTSLWIDPVSGRAAVLLSNRHHPAHRGTDLQPLRRRFHALVWGRLQAGTSLE